MDLYYSFVMHILSAQYKILGHRMRSLHFDEKNDSIVDARLNLIRQMHTHQHLNSIFKLIQHNLQWAYFSQIILSSIVICSMTRELAEVNTER